MLKITIENGYFYYRIIYCFHLHEIKIYIENKFNSYTKIHYKSDSLSVSLRIIHLLEMKLSFRGNSVILRIEIFFKKLKIVKKTYELNCSCDEILHALKRPLTLFCYLTTFAQKMSKFDVLQKNPPDYKNDDQNTYKKQCS